MNIRIVEIEREDDSDYYQFRVEARENAGSELLACTDIFVMPFNIRVQLSNPMRTVMFYSVEKAIDVAIEDVRFFASHILDVKNYDADKIRSHIQAYAEGYNSVDN